MIKSVPANELAPLEYRIALDASCTWLAFYLPIKLVCEQITLLQEVEQRIPMAVISPWSSGLWLEPQSVGWQHTLAEFSQQLASGSRLAILLSLPFARWLPERRNWSGTPLGERIGGLHKLLNKIPEYGFMVESVYGFHCGQSVILNIVAICARKIGRLANADRIEFAARTHYTQRLPNAWNATCALVFVHRQ